MSVKQVKPQKLSKHTIRKLWAAFFFALALSVLAQAFIHPHAKFEVDNEVWFYPAYGFFASAALVVVSVALGKFLKRKETYWEGKRK